MGIGLGANLIGMYGATKLPYNYKYETVDQIKNLKYNECPSFDINSSKYKRIVIESDTGMYYEIDD